MKKLLLLLMTGFCSPVIHAQQQTADFTEASEICFPDSLSRISEGSSDSLIYFTGGFVTPVHFAVNRDVPQPNDRLEPAFGLLDEIRHDPVYRLTYIWIGGSASPEGPTDWNLRLGQRRADALTRLIGDQTGLSAEWFRTDNLGEDWTSFERMLASDRRIPKRDEVLEILRSTPDNEARKRKIRDLDGGQTWQQIIRELFPPLRNARMVIVYQRPKNDGIGAEAAFPAPLLRVAEQPLPAAGLPAAPEGGCGCGKWLIAAKTNLLFDAALVANLTSRSAPAPTGRSTFPCGTRPTTSPRGATSACWPCSPRSAGGPKRPCGAISSACIPTLPASTSPSTTTPATRTPTTRSGVWA